MRDFKETSQELMDKFSTDLENVLREQIVQELKHEYDEKEKEVTNGLNQCKNGYKLKLQKIKQQIKAMKATVIQMEYLVNNCSQNYTVESGEETRSHLKSVDPCDELPLMFRRNYDRLLTNTAEKLNLLKSEVDLNSMIVNKNLRIPLHLGCFAFLYNPVSNSCNAVCPEATLALEYHDVPLGIKEMNFLKNTTLFRTEINNLSLCKQFKDDKKLHELLDYVGVKKIYFATLEGEIDVTALIEKYNIRHLKVLPKLTSPDFMLRPGINNLQYLNVSFTALSFLDALTIHRFLVSTDCSWISIGGSTLVTSTVCVLIKMWFNAQINFKSISVSVKKEGFWRVVSELYEDHLVRILNQKFYDIDLAGVRRILPDMAPMVLHGSDNVFVLPRENKDVLKIVFKQNGENWDVSLKKLGVHDEYDA